MDEVDEVHDDVHEVAVEAAEEDADDDGQEQVQVDSNKYIQRVQELLCKDQVSLNIQ